jgi:hypothetical protein
VIPAALLSSDFDFAIPGQQFVEALGWMGSDARQDVGEPVASTAAGSFLPAHQQTPDW